MVRDRAKVANDSNMLICALILSETLALYKSFTYLLTYLLNRKSHKLSQMTLDDFQEVITHSTMPIMRYCG